MTQIEEPTPLTDAEAVELLKLERFLASGFKAIRECADALRVIRDKKLYRERFQTFDEYCEQTWKKDSSTIRYLLLTEEQRKTLCEKFTLDKPLKTLIETAPDTAIRALEAVPKRSQKRVAKAAAEKNGKLTAKGITEAAEKPGRGSKASRVKPKPVDRIFPGTIEPAAETHTAPCSEFVSQSALDARISSAYGTNGHAAVAERPAVQAAKTVLLPTVLAVFDETVALRMDDWIGDDPDKTKSAVEATVECLRGVLERL